MIIAVPGAMPVTIPDVKPIVAIAVALLLQVTPVPENSGVVMPTHTFAEPDITGGRPFTLTTLVTKHPVPSV